MHEQEKEAVLANLTSSLAQALALGRGSLPAEKRAQLDLALEAGCRVEFVIHGSPFHMRCFIASPDLQHRELLFEVGMGEVASARMLN